MKIISIINRFNDTYSIGNVDFGTRCCYTTDFASDGSFCRLFFPKSRMKRKHIQYIA